MPEIRLRVSDQVTYRREAQARAELVLPDRVFYVGELIRGAIRMRGGENEAVVASYGLESLAEGFSMAVTAERQPVPDDLGQGLQTTFDLTPIREGAGEFSLNGIMLVQSGETGVFNQGGRDRPFAFRRRLTQERLGSIGIGRAGGQHVQNHRTIQRRNHPRTFAR